MAITVKHNKVSTVPDTADTSLVRPSDWNADHTLTGVGTMAEQNANNVSISGGSISGTTVSGYIPTSEKGAALGVATLDAGGKVPTSQIPLQGDLNYQGTWNASTNTPTLTSSTGTQGYYYVVDVAGSTNLNGITDWQVGDWAIFNGSVWQKVDNTDAVTSVNGQVGTVVLTTTNIAEGTNEYFTQARARQSISAGAGISYDNSTGVVTNSAPDQTVVLNAGTGISTSGTYPNFTITNTSPSLGGDVVGPSSATDNALARYDGTTGKLIQNSAVVVNDNGTMSGVESLVFDGSIPAATPVGAMWYDNATETLNFQQNNITQQIGEETLLYGKASSAINDSPLQIIYQTGVVGASGVITFAPTVAGLTNPNLILGCATEPIANNGFGRITVYGTVHNITTNGSAYGETWADGDVIWYNPVTGNPTNVKPTAPNMKVQLGIITHAGSGGSGSFQVLLKTGSELGGTDSNVNITSPTGGNLLSYDQTAGYWKNINLTDGTGISVTEATNGAITVTNTAPDQTVSISAGTGISTSGTYPSFTVTNTAPDQTVVMNSGTGISVSGTYPNFTVTNTAPSSGGTVTSVSGTAPIASSGGNTPTISISQATTSTDGYLSSTDWNTFNNKQPAGTYVTSVSATSPVTSTGGTTPTIAIPQASGSASGYLSSTDWTTFNSKASAFTYTSTYVPYGQGTTTPNQSSSFTFDGTSLTAPVHASSNGLTVNSATVSASFSIPSGSNAMSAGPVSIASGVTVTVPSGNAWVIV